MDDLISIWLEKQGVPVTRENWIDANWPDGELPEGWEDELPEELRSNQ